LSGTTANVAHQSFLAVGFAEAIGAFFLVFAVTNVVLRKMETIVAGAVIGGSLLLGICMASPFSNGILNPAVAFGIGSFGPMYVLGPIVGAICGAWAAKKLLEMA
jgi:glycerol uptake facilitator-like aquaporin